MTCPSTTTSLVQTELFSNTSNIFFIKMEYVLANLEGSNFQKFPFVSAPTMVGPP